MQKNGKTMMYVTDQNESEQLSAENAEVIHLKNEIRKLEEELKRQQEAETEKQQILADALARAEYASRAKTVFLNNMSHDIRTPMNAIIGFTALASAHLDNPDRVRDYLSKIAQSSNHLLSLINDVLDMSRIESGKLRLEEKPESLVEIMQNLRNMIQVDIHAKQLDLFIDTVDVTDEDIYCDKLRLNQVLLNLVSNAMKFTRPGGVISIRIREIASSSKGHATYEFHVKDTGIGMSREFTEHIFEPFTREDSATTSGIPGSGLGMAITKGIVDMQNGQIDVYSEEGKGSEFVVTLTFRLQKEHKELVVLEELEGIRSLVVDDDINACQSVSHMLRQIGLRAEWTMYGREAVVRTQEALEMGDRYQVYIIDWMMPDMNGIETARRIRKIVGEDAPIIILSAYDWAEIEEEAREAGVTGFVSKPIFVSDLQNVLMRYCSGKYEANEEEKYSFHRGLEGKRVLLAEDNRMNQEIAATIMEEEGLIVDIVENGQEACDKVKNSVPGYYDLVLMDIQMPVMDGYQAAQEIRKLENRQLANIPIVAMTANAFESDRQLALESGMNGHLPKPISIKELFKIIQQITVKPD